ncbi:MAG: flagellar brake protein [Lachnobacterium sp.]|nr:flagellar brake protein [Lachnobacterium sp.]
MNFSNIIIPGDKIDIRLLHQMNAEDNGGQKAKVYKSNVCEFISDQEMEILMPIQGSRMVLLQIGAECQFVFYTRRGLYSCDAIVRERYRKDNLYLLRILFRTEPKRFQRREFFRIDYITEMQLLEITEEVAALKTTELLFMESQDIKYIDHKKKAMICDISGGGVRFTGDTPLEPGQFVLLTFRLVNENTDECFYLVSQIVAIQKEDSDRYSCRAKFIFKDLKDREKIVRFVFEEERRIRRKEVG